MIAGSLLMYVRYRNGGSLAGLLDGLELDEAFLLGANNWVSHAFLHITLSPQTRYDCDFTRAVLAAIPTMFDFLAQLAQSVWQPGARRSSGLHRLSRRSIARRTRFVSRLMTSRTPDFVSLSPPHLAI